MIMCREVWEKIMLYVPSANPVSGFPSRSIATSSAPTKPSSSSKIRIEGAPGGVHFLVHSTFEATRTASKVVGPAVSGSAVPITGTNIRPGEPKWWATPPTETPKITCGPGVPTTLARVTPLEIEVLAWPAVPVSWPVHICCIKIRLRREMFSGKLAIISCYWLLLELSSYIKKKKLH